MKKLVPVVLVVAFALSVSVAFAAKVKCTVDKVDGDTVTLTCKKADKLSAGMKVDVKAKKAAAIEGC